MTRPHLLICLVAALVCWVALGDGLAIAQQRPGPKGGTAGIEAEEKLAIVAGISKYRPASGLAPLKYASKDATDLSAELTANGYQVRTLLDEDATPSLIRKALRELTQLSAQQRSSIVFYFSGHGFEKNGKNFLAGFGVAAEDIESDGLNLDEVLDILNASNAANSAVWIDACRIDATPGQKSAGLGSFEKLPKAAKTSVLFSTSPKQASYEDDVKNQGVFTAALLSGLRGEAKTADGKVTLSTLAQSVAESMRKTSFARGRTQTPILVATPEGRGFVVSTQRETEKGPKPDAQSAPASVMRRQLFAGGAFEISFDAAIWALSPESSGDQLQWTHSRTPLQAMLVYEATQNSMERIRDNLFEGLGGRSSVTIVEDLTPVKLQLSWSRFTLQKGNFRYDYLARSSEAGTIRAVVFGLTSNPIWAQDPLVQLYGEIRLPR